MHIHARGTAPTQSFTVTNFAVRGATQRPVFEVLHRELHTCTVSPVVAALARWRLSGHHMHNNAPQRHAKAFCARLHSLTQRRPHSCTSSRSHARTHCDHVYITACARQRLHHARGRNAQIPLISTRRWPRMRISTLRSFNTCGQSRGHPPPTHAASNPRRRQPTPPPTHAAAGHDHEVRARFVYAVPQSGQKMPTSRLMPQPEQNGLY